MGNLKKFSRRKFLSTMSAGSVAIGVTSALPAAGNMVTEVTANSGPDITDTNVHLFEWPFRHLKYGNTKALVTKLKKHRITKAWAGSYEALFTKSVDEMNARLTEECRTNGGGMLIPFGTVNPEWPDWEEDLRKCHEVYHMPGIRVYPAYQTFELNQDNFTKLIEKATERGLIVQISGNIEDPRVHHPIVITREIKFDPLADLLKKIPNARVQLLNWNEHMNKSLLEKLVAETKILFDIAWLESVGALGRLIDGNPWSGPQAPVPVERILFGSHAPLFPVESSLMKLFESPLSVEQMRAVMYENAGRFIKHA